ncbi:50S ribosomal protein L10 [Chlamydiales bacterium SCGC AG-110-P3]|nr:50S ribosomal protein L10 [Chlamydiales bacterium SCGC AG-110-P3]
MREEKQLLLDEIRDQIDAKSAFVLFNYIGLKANDLTGFRSNVADTGGHVEMVPKRILRRAAAEIGIDLSDYELPGHIALAFGGEDPVATAKTVIKFGKDTGTMTVLAGRFDNKLYDSEQVEALSKLPNLDGMRAQFLGLLEAPMAQTLAVMDALLTSVIFALENKVEKEGGAA